MWKTVAWTVGALAALALAGALATLYGGLYDVSATTQHTQPVYSLLEQAMKYSVGRRARDIAEPASLSAAPVLQRGAACYRDHCEQCHGGPGMARHPFGLSMQPLPSALIEASRHWKPRELYWITRHGIKMSGMPAWEFRLGEDDLWAVVAFVSLLPDLSAADYAARIADVRGETCTGPATLEAAAATDASVASSRPAAGVAVPPVSPERGQMALHQYACNTCHTIPGVTGAHPLVGPPLAGIGRRQLIAGRLANNPANMVAWIRAPHRFDPQTAMPDLGVTERDARDMAAYLSSLR